MKIKEYSQPDQLGNAKIIYPDGSWYFGKTAASGIRHGVGALYNQEGIMKDAGLWSNDKLVEKWTEHKYNSFMSNQYNK